VHDCILIVQNELDAKGLNFKPHYWISDEFFSPDGVPGVALPFYLFNAKLMELEKEKIGEVEGGTKEWLLKILRHEVGHAIDNAFGLRKLKQRQLIFGKSGTDYPESYLPKIYSKNYVLHLDNHYAQAHPDEDWAETFAVWLTPKSNRKKGYQNWPAYKKLVYLDEVMENLKGKKARVINKKKHYSLKNIKMTNGKHYQLKVKKINKG